MESMLLCPADCSREAIGLVHFTNIAEEARRLQNDSVEVEMYEWIAGGLSWLRGFYAPNQVAVRIQADEVSIDLIRRPLGIFVRIVEQNGSPAVA